MKRFSITLISFLLIFSCTTDKNTSNQLIDFIPSNTSILIKTNNLESLRSGLNNNSLIEELNNYTNVKDLESNLQNLKHLNSNNEVLICFGTNTSDSLEFSIITKYNKDLFKIDSIPNHSIETISKKNQTITKTTINNYTLYSIVKDSILFASNRLNLVENSNHKNLDTEFEKIYNSADPTKTLSVLINSKKENHLPSFFQTNILNNSQLSNYFLVDIDIAQNQIICNGITKAVDSSKSLINVFSKTIPQENQISKICPADVDEFLSITFNNFKTFKQNLIKFNPIDSLATETNVFDNVIEIGQLSKHNAQAIFLNSIDATATKDELNAQSLSETFREVVIYDFETPELFKNNLLPFISTLSASKFIILENYFVFSNDSEFLKEIISNVQNNTTLNEQNYYKDIMLSMSDESSLFIYNNASKLNSLFNDNFNEDKNLDINAYKATALQYIYDTDFAHVNAVTKTSKARANSNSVSEDINIALDNDLLIAPQLVTNHTNNQKDIAVQDLKNNLYLISNSGKIFWKKQLDGKILGNIEQIDIYKNGRLQLVFATSKRVYVLDRNGKDVTNFPLKFNDEITQPLSVFDYDKKKNYRLLVTQGKNLLMYDTSGKIVNGFTYKKAENNIVTQPEHFRVGKKDYIVFGQGETLEILDRVGKTRVNVKDKISFSDNKIYWYNNKFTTTNKNGILIQIDEKGRMSSSNLNLNEKHAITTTSKTLVTLSENKLKIKSKSLELDFGDYTAPQIFYLNDKIYVTTTDLQTKKVYLFDSQGKPISNFPVYGNSTIVLDNIDRDHNLEVVTKGDSNSIIIYQIN